MPDSSKIVALAAVAHPDDIEFMFAGTLLLLRNAGAEIHMWNLANGHCGTTIHNRDEIVRIRWEEAQASAKLAGATAHPPLFDDIGIFYDKPSVERVAAVVREIKPTILLTHSPQDYMEDHQNTCRLIVTAAFMRQQRNFTTDPQRPPYEGAVAIYHALPHGLCDGLRQRIEPDFFVNITSVLEKKRVMLAEHRSQQEWLHTSQGMNNYISEMESLSRQVGKMSGRFPVAEGSRRHSHLGFGPEEFDPLAFLLPGFIAAPPRARE